MDGVSSCALLETQGRQARKKLAKPFFCGFCGVLGLVLIAGAEGEGLDVAGTEATVAGLLGGGAAWTGVAGEAVADDDAVEPPGGLVEVDTGVVASARAGVGSTSLVDSSSSPSVSSPASTDAAAAESPSPAALFRVAFEPFTARVGRAGSEADAEGETWVMMDAASWEGKREGREDKAREGMGWVNKGLPVRDRRSHNFPDAQLDAHQSSGRE